MTAMADLTIDWTRSILIDGVIDEDMVKRLTPSILLLRQSGDAPITVGIDSTGGSLASLDVLLGLLTSPNQDGTPGQTITVATHRAYSAAANFLAFGNYAVALAHSQVLYHDVRYGGMDDVTPEKARDAAKSLQDANDAFALRLAHRVIRRLVWIYLDLRKSFPEFKARYPKKHATYAEACANYAPEVDAYEGVDLAGFAISLWAKLSSKNDVLIENVMNRLGTWIHLTKLVKSVPAYRAKGSRIPGLLDGSKHLFKLFRGKQPHLDATAEHLKTLLSLILADISETTNDRIDFASVLDRAVREFGILNTMNDPKHVTQASRLLLQHSTVFFGRELAGELDAKPEAERKALLAKSAPNATLFWHFCVLLCRELFEGEHILKPNDAQLLGLVDEVAGGGPVQSRRAFRIESAKKKAPGTKTGPP
jgi:ATP-dependent protease ClpP protease subunit